MWLNTQFPSDLVTFTEEILDGKLYCLCSGSNKNSPDSSDSLVRNKNKLNPPRNSNKVLDRVIDFPRKQKFEETNQINKSNILKHERKGLLELENKQNLYVSMVSQKFINLLW